MSRLPPFLAALAIVLAACLLPAAPAQAAKDYYSMKDEKLVKLAGKGDREAIEQLTRPNRRNPKTQGSEPRPIEERLPWLRKGAELDLPYARSMLGMHLLQPPAGTAPDYGGAAHWLALAMQRFPAGAETTHQEARDLHAILTYARRMHAVTTTPPADTPEALFEAAQAYKPVRIYRDTTLGDDAEYRRLMRRAAELGHVEAQLQMPGLAASREEALEWRRKLAEGGNVAAMEGMAAEFAGRDKAASWDWHRRAAEAGSSNSAYWYGMHLQDKGDKAGAIQWLERAAAVGHIYAQAQLATLVDPYVVRLTEAAGKGDGAAALELGDYYRKKGDKERAYRWYYRANDLKSLEGTYQLALLTNIPASQRYFMEQAALGGHAGAKAWLANDAQRGQRAVQQAAQQMEAGKRQAFVARIDREGSTDKLEVEYYCQYGGRRCNELRGIAQRAEQGRNAQVQSDNMRRIQEVHSTGKGDSDAAARARSECMRRKTESIQRSTYGQQDWKFTGECP